ncbi:MAG TPA: hypothetical protein VMF91_18460 [Bryobacteraceae bacterium]|nr:hypothetical protein [Bryobacteraceae bacterium]
MARGWESKAVESQIEAAETRAAHSHQPQLSGDELRRQRERESLELSRTRVMQDLAAARNSKYREILELSLRYLDDKIAALIGS